MKKLLVLIFSIFISLNSYGEWTYIGYTASGNDFYIESNTIKEHGGHVYWWDLSDYLKPSKWGNLSVKMYKEGDCGVNRFKPLSSVFYNQSMGEGVSESSYSPPDAEWQYPVPGSISSDLLNYACNNVN